MTIQLPNPGTGNGQTGDNEFVLWQKTRANFEQTENAASRLVGKEAGNVMQVGAFGFGSDTKVSYGDFALDATSSEATKTQMVSFGNTGVVGYGSGLNWSTGTYTYSIIGGYSSKSLYLVSYEGWAAQNARNPTYSRIWVENLNTTVDPNGFIRAASPVIDLYDNHIDVNSDAEQQNITMIKNDTGDYTLKTKTGLRSDGGWDVALPWDLRQQNLFEVVVKSLDDGAINIKCYKRGFDMSTFSFIPDLDNPIDITNGRFMSVRLNDNAVESIDESAI